jgi:hypothetical protein
MKVAIIIGVIIILGIGITIISTNKAEGIEVTMYKSASCGCCVGHASYLDGKGYDVNKIELQDLSGIKSQYNIPPEMQSCHTNIIESYFVEGHVPIEAIDRLLEEKPNIKGISLPRMPSGSPGMPGQKTGDFIIYALDNNGEWNEWMRI